MGGIPKQHVLSVPVHEIGCAISILKAYKVSCGYRVWDTSLPHWPTILYDSFDIDRSVYTGAK